MLLRERLLSAMGKLGLYGMKGTFDELIATGIKQRATPEKILLDLLEAEMAERRIRSIRYRMGLAKFPVEKDLDHFEFTESPVNEQQIRTLYEGSFLAQKSNIILVGALEAARRTWQSPSPGRPSETASVAGSSICSIWLISWNKKNLPGKEGNWQKAWPDSTSWCWMNWATYRSQRQAASCYFT